MRISRRLAITVAALLTIGVVAVGVLPSADAAPARRHRVLVPEADRFTPAGLTIHAGDTVQWVNRDTDNHTVVSDDAFTTADHAGTDVHLVGTDDNGGQPGTVQLTFSQPGMFFYYCRLHARLDASRQPVAPGPDGGIQSNNGNFGTPMMGVITVLP
jgi:plastocyanin